MTPSLDPDDDSDLPDPTYGYFVVFENPPPDVRTLAGARTDADAIRDAIAVAQDSAAVLTLRHRTVSATLDLGTAHPDGTFIPSSTPIGGAPLRPT
ncbi:hypothetical protein [Azospirillum canadense]|uniref:hypothetical protein n=1 Tax=Azospirillum canadense TaxID=403962 RepID=UPI002227F7CB|nr:hypothetical protein [Azospirillum canadense]MCW2240354.1 hypothetical protein [Azospirillum canadense]